ncbi:MAG: glycosyl transferase, family 2, partial [Bryobacterales bacterium]|nr:glycosyl transferase, family 2 [Bryobacterales bacterium]
NNQMKSLSIVTPCYNEEMNVREVYDRVRKVIAGLGKYRYEHIFIDNCSTDRTLELLKEIAAADTNVKVIANARNFGHIRSPIHAFHQAQGDAVMGLVADLQDPPELIPELVHWWEQGYKMVVCIKKSSKENRLMFWMRTRYYQLVNRISNIETFENFTGFGLYDRQVCDIIRSFKDPYPYFRGMIAEIGLPYKEIAFTQPRRERGITKNNWYTLYDMAMLGITNLSKVPLRLATFTGMVTGGLSIMVAVFYLVYKLVFWNRFEVGIAPLVIGIFLFASVQLVCLGIIGEYIGSIFSFVQNRPLVIERERVNFEHGLGEPKKMSGDACGPRSLG